MNAKTHSNNAWQIHTKHSEKPAREALQAKIENYTVFL
jgi:hypothetical protein